MRKKTPSKTASPKGSTDRCYGIDTLGDLQDDSLCFLSNSIKGFTARSQLFEGEKLGKRYPRDARIYMDGDHQGTKLSGVIGNTDNNWLVHQELKALIERHCGDTVEYLPVSIYDHSKRLASDAYFIINPLAKVDCLDRKKSYYEVDDDDRNRFYEVEPVIVPKKIAKAPQLFRIKQCPEYMVMRFELANEITRGRFTNFGKKRLPFSHERR